ncbi:hypothetical protein BH10ACI3_BH10ACI3_12180 [soil metagenome]
MATKRKTTKPATAKRSSTTGRSTAKRSASKGTLETIYYTAKNVVGEILHGGATDAAAGTVMTVAEAVGLAKPQKKTAKTASVKSSNGTSPSNGKKPPAKSTAAAKPSPKTAKPKAAAKAPASDRSRKTPARTSA